MTTPSSNRDQFGRFVKKVEESGLEMPNENPDIGKEGPQPNPLAAKEKTSKKITPQPSTKIIPDAVAGIWHVHKRQGLAPAPASAAIPGATFAMVIPTDEFTCRLVLRVDLRDASGMSTSMTSIEMGSEDAMKLLSENYLQTQFFISNYTTKKP